LCGRDSLVGSCDRLFLGEALFHQIRQIDFNRLRREFSPGLLTRHVAPDSFDLILIPGGAETRRQRRGVVENYRLSLLAWLASRWRLRFLCDRRRSRRNLIRIRGWTPLCCLALGDNARWRGLFPRRKGGAALIRRPLSFFLDNRSPRPPKENPSQEAFRLGLSEVSATSCWGRPIH